MRLLRRSLPSTQSLFVFEAVARQLSFKRAAGELNITQPSVSYAIRKLETHLDIKLFIRKYRRIELTEAGAALYRDVSAAFDMMESSLSGLKSAGQNVVRLAMSSVFAAYFLLPRMPSFEARHPDIKLMFMTVDWDVEPDDTIDLSIKLGPAGLDGPGTWRIADEEVFPVCSQGYLDSADLLRTPLDLSRHRLLHLRDRHFRRTTWKEWADRSGYPTLEIPDGIVLDNYQIVLHAAMSGQGVALGWRHITDYLLKRGLLTNPIGIFLKTGSAFYVRSRSGARPPPSAERVKDWLLDESAQFRAENE